MGCGCETRIYKKTDPSITKLRALINCRNGSVEVYLPTPISQEHQMENDCGLSECYTEHEEDHIKAINATCGNVCKDKRCPEDSIIAVLYDGGSCSKALECSGLATSIICAARKVFEHRRAGNTMCPGVAFNFFEQQVRWYFGREPYGPLQLECDKPVGWYRPSIADPAVTQLLQELLNRSGDEM